MQGGRWNCSKSDTYHQSFINRTQLTQSGDTQSRVFECWTALGRLIFYAFFVTPSRVLNHHQYHCHQHPGPFCQWLNSIFSEGTYWYWWIPWLACRVWWWPQQPVRMLDWAFVGELKLTLPLCVWRYFIQKFNSLFLSSFFPLFFWKHTQSGTPLCGEWISLVMPWM